MEADSSGLLRRFKNVFPYFTIVQVIFSFPLGLLNLLWLLENRLPLKLVLNLANYIALWRDLMKPILRFSFFCVFFVSKAYFYIFIVFNDVNHRKSQYVLWNRNPEEASNIYIWIANLFLKWVQNLVLESLAYFTYWNITNSRRKDTDATPS